MDNKNLFNNLKKKSLPLAAQLQKIEQKRKQVLKSILLVQDYRNLKG